MCQWVNASWFLSLHYSVFFSFTLRCFSRAAIYFLTLRPHDSCYFPFFLPGVREKGRSAFPLIWLDEARIKVWLSPSIPFPVALPLLAIASYRVSQHRPGLTSFERLPLSFCIENFSNYFVLTPASQCWRLNLGLPCVLDKCSSTASFCNSWLTSPLWNMVLLYWL